MNKSELIAAVASRSRLTKAEAAQAVDALSDVITAALSVGDEVTLPNIGKLHAAHREARVGRNPKTGEAATIPASSTAKFKVSSTLKAKLNEVAL